MDETRYRIGEIAARTGLTVRALRHYDAQGLLTPTARTPAGQRLYSAADVERLQRIVSLRALGLPLADVRAALGTAEPLAVVERHLALVRARIEAHTRLADRLDALAAGLRHAGEASVETLFHLIALTAMFEKHFTPEQLDELRARADAVGREHIGAVEAAWPELFAALDGLRASGVAPEAPETAPLVARAQGLVAEFTGGDAGLQRSLNAAVAADRDAMYAAWGITPELGAYYDAAMQAHAGA